MSRQFAIMGAGTRLLGVLNVTPDSFSDGSQFEELDIAIERGLELKRHGASIIDVGGESTRPGATLVGAEEEQRRVLPLVSALTDAGLTVSVDTIHASTAKLSVLSGARIINDVSGGTYDPEMLKTVAELCSEYDVSYIIGHWRGIPDINHDRSVYQDVVGEVCTELKAQAVAAIAAGVPRNRIILDPGLGFDKDASQSWQILRNIDQLKSLGFAVCIGVSRKRMMGDIVLKTAGQIGDFKERDLATAATTLLASQADIELVRVHDVLGSAQVLEVAREWGAPTPTQTPTQATTTTPTQNPAYDKIKLTGLEVFAHHGVFDFERENGQKFLLDIEVVTDMSPAISGDALAETVHYGELAEQVVQAVKRDPVDLIETLADRVANVALSFAACQQVTVTVHKPDAPIEAKFDDVSVTITRVKAGK